MRILISAINFAPEVTGIGRFTGEMAEWLAQRGHEIIVVTAPPYYPQWRVAEGYSAWKYRKESINGAVVLRCPLWVPKKVSALGRLIHYLSFGLSSLPALVITARRFRPDLIFTIEPPVANSLSALVAARICGAPKWLHVQDFEIDTAFELKILKSARLRTWIGRFERWLMRRFDRISTISPQMHRRLLEKGIESERRRLVPNWVDTRAIAPGTGDSQLRRELGIPDETTIVLYSGSLGLKQGLEIIGATAAHLADRDDILLVVCGDGPARAPLNNATREMSNVRWIPLQPESRLNDLLNFADIHLLPQRPGVADLVMPSKVLGMLASERPIVATAAPGTGLAEMVDRAGIVVEPGSSLAVADAIIALTDDPSRRAELGARGRAFVIANFERDQVLADLERELKNIVACGCRRS